MLVIAAVLGAVPVDAVSSGGGTVNNKAATVQTFTSAAATYNTGSVVEFTGTVKDLNGEGDLVDVKVATTSGPVAISETYTIVAADRTATSAGAFSGNPGFDVYNSNSGFTTTDGILQFRFQASFLTSGTYVLRASVKDEGSFAFGPAADFTLTIVDKIQVAADPVDAAGAAISGASWGGWTADPGAANVLAQNFLKVTNTGASATQEFTLNLDPAFASGGNLVDIDGNLEFSCAEGTSSEDPEDLTFPAYTDTGDSDGAVTLTFAGTGNHFYCKYQIVALPAILADGVYSASFTALPA